MRLIVKFLFKRHFFRMKSNLKDTFSKKSFEFSKGFLKKVFTHPNILVIVHFHSHSNKRPSGPQKYKQMEPYLIDVISSWYRFF